MAIQRIISSILLVAFTFVMGATALHAHHSVVQDVSTTVHATHDDPAAHDGCSLCKVVKHHAVQGRSFRLIVLEFLGELPEAPAVCPVIHTPARPEQTRAP